MSILALLTAITIAVTFGWILVDSFRTRRTVSATLIHAPITIVPIPRDEKTAVLELYVESRMDELLEMKKDVGAERETELRRTTDYSRGSDTQIVKAIDMKIEIAKSIAQGVRKKS